MLQHTNVFIVLGSPKVDAMSKHSLTSTKQRGIIFSMDLLATLLLTQDVVDLLWHNDTHVQIYI